MNTFHLPTEIRFEVESTHNIGPYIEHLGKRIVLLVLEEELRNIDEFAVIKHSLEKHSHGVIIYDDCKGDPTFKDIDSFVYFCNNAQVDVIVSYGSIETFNMAKAAAYLATNYRFAEEIFASSSMYGSEEVQPSLPFVLIPTLPSMGAEIAPFFYTIDKEQKNIFFKHFPGFHPSMALIDPNILTPLSVKELTNASIMTLAAAIDSIVSKNSNFITDTLALKGVELLMRNIQRLQQGAGNIKVIGNLAMASILVGMATASTSMGLCFALGLALKLVYDLDPSISMGILLPHVMEYYLIMGTEKYVQIARSIGIDIKNITKIEAAIKPIEEIRKLYSEIKFPDRLSSFEVQKADFPNISSIASQFSFLKNAPRPLNKNEIETILIAAY